MTGYSQARLDLRECSGAAAPEHDLSGFPSSPLRVLECEDRDRLHWARSRLNSVLEHESSRFKVLLRIKRGESACVEGQVAEGLFLVERGLLKLSLVSIEGTQSAPQIVGDGDCFGEECAGEGEPHYGETAIALTPTTLIKIARKDILKKLEKPYFAKLYISAVVHRLHEYEDSLVQRASESSEQRLARVLAKLTKFGNWRNGKIVVVPRITHESLSEIVGTTRSRITFFMGRLATRGIIQNAGRGLVIDADRLFERSFREAYSDEVGRALTNNQKRQTRLSGA